MTAALAAAARQRSDQTRQRATQALQRLPRHRPTDHVRTRRPHSRRVPVLALPPARSASRHRPTPSSCHNPGRPHPTSRARINPIAATTAQRRPRRNHQTQNRQSPTPTTPRPTPRPPAPKPPPHPVSDMSPTQNPSSQPQQRQALQIRTNNLLQVLRIRTNNLLQVLRRVAHGFTNPDNFAARGLLVT